MVGSLICVTKLNTFQLKSLQTLIPQSFAISLQKRYEKENFPLLNIQKFYFHDISQKRFKNANAKCRHIKNLTEFFNIFEKSQTFRIKIFANFHRIST